MEEKKGYRHGELLFVEINEIPKDIIETNTNIIATGKTGGTHSFDNGKFYVLESGNIIGFFKSDNTILYHKEHGIKINGKKLREAKLPDGYYEIRKQVEYTHDGMRPVED